MIAYEIYCNNNKNINIYKTSKRKKGRKKKQETQCDKTNTMNDKENEENSFYRRETDQWTGS